MLSEASSENAVYFEKDLSSPCQIHPTGAVNESQPQISELQTGAFRCSGLFLLAVGLHWWGHPSGGS